MKKLLLSLLCISIVNCVVSAQSLMPVDSTHVVRLIENTTDIVQNTDSWHGSLNIFVSILAVLSSFFSIVAGVFAFGIWRDRRVSKKLQMAIINDLIRHFFVNKSILLRMQRDNECLGANLSFRKMAVLQDDLNMNRFTIYPRYYRCVHEIEFQARNYNLYCEWLSASYSDFSQDERIACLKDLISRGNRLSAYLDMLKKEIAKTHFCDFFTDITNPKYKSENEIIIESFAHHYTNVFNTNKDAQVEKILYDLVEENINYLDMKL
jgi:hypothetical protein